MQAGFVEMGVFGHKCKTKEHIRIIFEAEVSSASVSGLCAFPWSPVDGNPIRKNTCQLLRRLGVSKAYARDEDGQVTCSLNNQELMMSFGFAPHFVEPGELWLRMYQKLEKEPITICATNRLCFWQMV